jgi:signal transduction histidine kinase
MSHRTVLVTACAGVAVAAAAAVLPVVVGPSEPPLQIVRHVAIGVAWTSAGLVAAWQRPGNRIGPLMIAFGFLWYVNDINFWKAAFPFTVAELLANLYLAVGAHVLVAFPSGRLSTRLERVVVALAYVDALVIANLNTPFWDPGMHGCTDCPHNLVLVHASRSMADAADLLANIVAAVVAAGIVVVLLERWRGSTPAARRVLTPVLWAGGLLAVTQGLYAFENGDNDSLIAVVAGVVLTAFPLVVLGALLSVRWHRGAIAQLVIELGSALSPSGIRAPLAKALGDPSLEVAFWIPAEGRYIDPDGHQIEVSTADPRQAVSVLRHEGEPIAAITYDASLIEEQTFLEAVAAATRLALENARLQAEVRAQLVEVRASRARILAAGDEERKRLERNLHDGAQQRLLATRLALQLARGGLEGGNGQASTLLDEADAEVKGALEDIRSLARGLHPAILSDEGLAAALATLARRSEVPVEILSVPHDRLPGEVETAAYFLAAEALANTAKHAQASRVRIAIRRNDEQVVALIDDDGRGGALIVPGGGLAGLRDRIDAIGGHLTVSSPSGAGTHLRAEIPCA